MNQVKTISECPSECRDPINESWFVVLSKWVKIGFFMSIILITGLLGAVFKG